MKSLPLRSMLYTALLAGLTGCGAATTTGDGATTTGDRTDATSAERTIIGFVPSTGAAPSLSVKGASKTGCAADTVQAVEAEGAVTSAPVDADCYFRLVLKIRRTYAFHLFRKASFLATLLFGSGSGSGTSQLPVHDGSEIALGLLTLQGEDAIPENDPLGDTGEEPLADDEPYIVQATPTDGASGAARDEPITVQASCPIDRTQASEANFHVGDADGGHLICTVRFPEAEDTIVCEHDGLLAGMAYTLTVEGLQCVDPEKGTIRTSTWHFTTE